MRRGWWLLVPLVGLVAAPARAQYTPPVHLAEPGSLSDRYLTVGEARDVLHASNKAFQDCFLRSPGKAAPNDVNLMLTVGNDGRPAGVDLEIPEGFQDLRECLIGVASSLVFAPHDGDPMSLAYPLVFVRDERGSRLVPYPIVFVRPRERAFLLIPLPLTLTPEERAELQRLLYP